MTTWAPPWDERWDGPRQHSRRKGTDSVLSFLRPDDESEDKYSYVWERWANSEWWEHRLREDLLQWAQEGRDRAIWWKLAQQEGMGGPARRAELEAFLVENDAMPELSPEDAEWIADQRRRYPHHYGLQEA